MATPGPKPISRMRSLAPTSSSPMTSSAAARFIHAMISPPNRPSRPLGRPNSRSRSVGPQAIAVSPGNRSRHEYPSSRVAGVARPLQLENAAAGLCDTAVVPQTHHQTQASLGAPRPRITSGVIASMFARAHNGGACNPQPKWRSTMRDAAKLAEDYIALWNEPDPSRRMALLAATWTTNATYVDPLMQGQGHREIDGLIAAAQAKFPDLRFGLLTPADGFGGHVRFSWGLGSLGHEPVIKGTDFVARDGDRIQSVVGFLDQVPAGA